CSVCLIAPPLRSPLFPYTTLFRSQDMRMTRWSDGRNEPGRCEGDSGATLALMAILMAILVGMVGFAVDLGLAFNERRQDQASVEIGRAHSELQSRENLVCRLLLEK